MNEHVDLINLFYKDGRFLQYIFKSVNIYSKIKSLKIWDQCIKKTKKPARFHKLLSRGRLWLIRSKEEKYYTKQPQGILQRFKSSEKNESSLVVTDKEK